MRFSAIHKVASYLMVAAAFAALALSRELPPLVVALTVVGAGLSFFAEPARHPLFRHRFWGLGWNIATLTIFAFLVVDALRGEALYAGVRFLCFLLVNKLWNRRASRDYLQAYVVSFLMLVAGAALSSDLSYAGCFLAYVVFATWTLTLFHLRREMEENYLLKHSDGAQSERVEVERILNSRRIVGPSFLAASSLVSVGIFVSASLVFFLIPRFGFGFFVSHGRRGQLTIGFSDRVGINDVGLVKDNPQVVMRIEMAAPPPEPLHLRGLSFDRYQNGQWSRTPQPTQPLRRWGSGIWFVGIGKAPLGRTRARALLAPTMAQQVYLDPLDTPVLFGASQPVAFELPPTLSATPIELEDHGDGEVFAMERHVDANGRVYGVERKNGLRYTVYSDLHGPSDAVLTAAGEATATPELAPYLAVPADLPPRIAELARSITRGHEGPYRKALAIERYLARYRYTLELKRNERYEPLEDFLFVQRAGACGYFASALAILLRTVGVPARTVNGFYGGEWNSYGHYLAVRQGHAHVWVEVWIDGAGWVLFDPTPAGPAATGVPAWNTLRQMLDTVELTWFKYVIEYDLGKQVDLINGVRDWSHGLSRSGDLRRALAAHRRALGVVALVAGLAVLLAVRRRRPPRVRLPQAHVAATHAYGRALKALERRGFPRAPSETGRELAARVENGGDPGAAAFHELVELYYAVRFGDAPAADDELDRLAVAVIRPTPPTTPERRAV
jgi:transglutaminase-like putative cysteine protease